jgi:hypothetical protein
MIPIRVDRIEHNEDIDDKIIFEIERCDFALADLTYARPSVYFEAGYAGRTVPVIYTCRRDHLRPRADDSYGNLRVHFDLQMKNIIPWSNSSDRKFVERLRKRIVHVTTPLLRHKEIEVKKELDVRRFASLSLVERINKVVDICIQRTRRIGYKGVYADQSSLSHWFKEDIAGAVRGLSRRAESLAPGWIGTRLASSGIHTTMIHVTDVLTKKELTNMYDSVLTNPTYDLGPASRRRSIRRLVEHLYILSLKKVPSTRIAEALPHFKFDEEHNEYTLDTEESIPTYKKQRYGEIYAMGPSRTLDLRFVVHSLTGVGEAKIHRIDKEQVTAYDSQSRGNIRVGSLKRLSRHIHIRMIAGIKSESEIRSTFSQVQKDVEGESH